MINIFRHQQMNFSELTQLIENDKEPYSQFYHPAVHAARSYVTIQDYEPTTIVDKVISKEVMNKLSNEK